MRKLKINRTLFIVANLTPTGSTTDGKQPMPIVMVGAREGLNLCQRERRLCLRDDAAPDEGEVMSWRQGDITSFGVMTGVIALYARGAPCADPHAGSWGLETPGYPIRRLCLLPPRNHQVHLMFSILLSQNSTVARLQLIICVGSVQCSKYQDI